jgi:hypothetical protein
MNSSVHVTNPTIFQKCLEWKENDNGLAETHFVDGYEQNFLGFAAFTQDVNP